MRKQVCTGENREANTKAKKYLCASKKNRVVKSLEVQQGNRGKRLN